MDYVILLHNDEKEWDELRRAASSWSTAWTATRRSAGPGRSR
jgi:hypothetical protein